MVSSYDTAVADLAFLFLTDKETRHRDQQEHEKRIQRLALTIQQVIEDWLDSHPLTEEEQRP